MPKSLEQPIDLIKDFKNLMSLVAKRVNQAQAKDVKTIVKDFITGDDPSFYMYNTRDGGNEIDTYLHGVPYNSVFTGDKTLGPQYDNYTDDNYPGKHIPNFNAFFGDTLLIDPSQKENIEWYINTGNSAQFNPGGYVTPGGDGYKSKFIENNKSSSRTYDGAGMLGKFRKDQDGNIYADVADIYDFNVKDFAQKYFGGMDNKGMMFLLNTMNNMGNPFIVRQNNIPVVFRKPYNFPDYKTDSQRRLGWFLNNVNLDLNLPLKMTDKEIESLPWTKNGDEMIKELRNRGLIK